MQGDSAFLLYDSRCGPCSSFMSVVKMLDKKNRIVPVSLYSRLALELVGQRLSKSEMMASFHLVIKDASSSQIFSAGSGLIQLLRYLPGGSLIFPIARSFGPGRAFIRWLYRQIAKIRDRSVSCNL